jgi:hypothetical protein
MLNGVTRTLIEHLTFNIEHLFYLSTTPLRHSSTIGYQIGSYSG